MREGEGGNLRVCRSDANTPVAEPFELLSDRIIKRQHAPPVEETGQPREPLVIRDLTAHVRVTSDHVEPRSQLFLERDDGRHDVVIGGGQQSLVQRDSRRGLGTLQHEKMVGVQD